MFPYTIRQRIISKFSETREFLENERTSPELRIYIADLILRYTFFEGLVINRRFYRNMSS